MKHETLIATTEITLEYQTLYCEDNCYGLVKMSVQNLDECKEKWILLWGPKSTLYFCYSSRRLAKIEICWTCSFQMTSRMKHNHYKCSRAERLVVDALYHLFIRAASDSLFRCRARKISRELCKSCSIYQRANLLPNAYMSYQIMQWNNINYRMFAWEYALTMLSIATVYANKINKHMFHGQTQIWLGTVVHVN